jgi:hypothetical protein
MLQNLMARTIKTYRMESQGSPGGQTKLWSIKYHEPRTLPVSNVTQQVGEAIHSCLLRSCKTTTPKPDQGGQYFS